MGNAEYQLPDAGGHRLCHGGDSHWRDFVLFHEHFHGDTGRGLGARHQNGWTALVAQCLENVAAGRTEGSRSTPGRAAGRPR